MTEVQTPPNGGDTVKLYVATEGLVGRDGGPYLDVEEQWEAEKRRAYVEGREPVPRPKTSDDEPLPATAGTKLVTASELLAGVGVNVPSLTGDNKVKADAELVDSIVASDQSNIRVHQEVPAEAFAPIPETLPPEESAASVVPEPNVVDTNDNPDADEAAEETTDDPYAGTDAETTNP